MAISRRPTDLGAYQTPENRTPETETPGFYSRTNLNDIINNFIVAYIGEGKVLQNVPRHEVAFWAQRTLQEFSYDILHSEKAIEVELNDVGQMKLPPDYVNYVKLTFLDNAGFQRTIQPSKRSFSNQAVLQDQNYDYLFDDNGKLLEAEMSEGDMFFQDPNRRAFIRSATSYYYGYYDDDDYSYYYYSYFGRRYGNDPQFENINGTFYIDTLKGIIYFDYNFLRLNGVGGNNAGNQSQPLITLRYISDGLAENDNFANVYVPKMAEDAMYASMLYNLAKLRPSASGAAGLYKKEAYAKLRNTKIRLANMKLEEMAQVLRGRAKWIKH